MRRRAGLWGVALAALCSAAPVCAEGITASDALKDILSGNESFQKNETLAKRRAVVAQSQSPQAIILSCSDSRVPPEAVFNRYVGRLFVVRTAGHAVGDFEYASIEYAVEHLHVPLLVVLGHERCGAIKATVEAVQGGGAAHEAREPAAPATPAADDDDADHPHHKAHRADRNPTDDELGQRAGACAPKTKAHAAEDEGEDEDSEAAAPPAKKSKAGKKKLKHKAAPADDEDAAADDDDEDTAPRKRKAKAPAPDDDEDEDEGGDEAAERPEAHAAPAPAPRHGAAEHISALVSDLETPVREALNGKPADPVDAAVRVNTKWVAKRLVEESGVIREATAAGKLRIVGARYDLDTGAVEILE